MTTTQSQTFPINLTTDEWCECTSVFDNCDWNESQVLEYELDCEKCKPTTISDLSGAGWKTTQYFCKKEIL